MRCPFCKTDRSRVVDSRSAQEGFVIRRRRECLDCSRRYTTYEKIEETPLRVIKKDGGRAVFERNKILSGLIRACEKRPIALETLEEVTDRIERRINERFEREVSSREIGEMVMDELRTLDHVAFVRFASVYREFTDLSAFETHLKELRAQDR